jgi:type II secretory ATPase GspE/PulE/Tfp pilus assembly ATPase PilB-like protein
MPNTTVPSIPRRAFLGSLLFATSSGCGGKGITKNTDAGQEQPKQTEVPASTAVAAGVPRLEDSGMRPKIISEIRRLIAQPAGMLLCCGPTDSGWTATLYACLREVDRHKKILTIEDPIEHRLDDIAQKQIDTKSGQTLAGSLPSILEQDPDAVMIGEIRDRETATIACRAAVARCLVFTGMHANDTLTALFRLLELEVEPSLIASATCAVLAQRLVRLLCESCKEPYKPQPEFLKKAHIPPETVDVFYRSPLDPEPTCPGCGGTGYVGQTGIFELLIVSEPIRKILRNDPSLNAIKAEARKNGLIYLQEDGLRQVILGRTSISELLRVLR